MTHLTADLVRVLTERGLTLACAESLTAGLVSAGVADVPGASAVLRGGAVTYATETKATVLGVDADLLRARGAVDPDVAAQMAAGAARVFGADIGVATTGVAGPTPQDGKDVGTCFVGVWTAAAPGSAQAAADAERGEEYRDARACCDVQGFSFQGGRAEIRRQAAEAAWRLVLDTLTTFNGE